MTVELVTCEAMLLEEIGNKVFTREDVAKTYALTLVPGERSTVDLKRVNTAIVARWSVSALKWIKERAWKIAQNGGRA